MPETDTKQDTSTQDSCQDSEAPTRSKRLEIRNKALRAARAVAMAGLIAATAGCGARSTGDRKDVDGGPPKDGIIIVDTTVKKDTLDCSKEWKPGCPAIGPAVPPEMPAVSPAMPAVPPAMPA
jgi:hypothetical protein